MSIINRQEQLKDTVWFSTSRKNLDMGKYLIQKWKDLEIARLENVVAQETISPKHTLADCERYYKSKKAGRLMLDIHLMNRVGQRVVSVEVGPAILNQIKDQLWIW